MSTKYGILSLGFIGCLAVVAGAYYLHSLHGVQGHESIVRMQIILTRILLFGGLATMVISAFFYWLYIKWKNGKDLPECYRLGINIFGCTVFTVIVYFSLHSLFGVSFVISIISAIPIGIVGYFVLASITDDLDFPKDSK